MVDGGKASFTPTASRTSAAIVGNPATISGGTASVTATANATLGVYTVTTRTRGVSGGASLSLTNTPLAVERITFVVR